MPNTKEQIQVALDRLPEEKHEEVLDFIEFLEHRIDASDDEPSENGREDLNPEDDPILEAIGSVDADLGSERVDEILYGK
jgi:hypothetical protein